MCSMAVAAVPPAREQDFYAERVTHLALNKGLRCWPRKNPNVQYQCQWSASDVWLCLHGDVVPVTHRTSKEMQAARTLTLTYTFISIDLV